MAEEAGMRGGASEVGNGPFNGTFFHSMEKGSGASNPATRLAGSMSIPLPLAAGAGSSSASSGASGAAADEVRAHELKFMTLPPSSFNLAMGWLSVRDRSRVAACSTKSAADVTSLYEAVWIGGGKVLDDEKLANLFDLSDVKLTEAQLEQLVAGSARKSLRFCGFIRIGLFDVNSTTSSTAPCGSDWSRRNHDKQGDLYC